MVAASQAVSTPNRNFIPDFFELFVTYTMKFKSVLFIYGDWTKGKHTSFSEPFYFVDLGPCFSWQVFDDKYQQVYVSQDKPDAVMPWRDFALFMIPVSYGFYMS